MKAVFDSFSKGCQDGLPLLFSVGTCQCSGSSWWARVAGEPRFHLVQMSSVAFPYEVDSVGGLVSTKFSPVLCRVWHLANGLGREEFILTLKSSQS